MIEITTHQVEGDTSQQIQIEVMDGAGPGGAHHHYRILTRGDRQKSLQGGVAPRNLVDIHFQFGPIGDYGVNGISIEALLAICAHRLECFQAGPFACTNNEDALRKINNALTLLQFRTRDRVARGVEGRNVA